MLCGLFSSKGYSLLAVHRLLIAVASLAAEHRTQSTQAPQLQLLGSGAQAQQLCHTGLVALWLWNLPRPGIKPMSPVLAGRFFTTEPSGKPLTFFNLLLIQGRGLSVQLVASLDALFSGISNILSFSRTSLHLQVVHRQGYQ